MIFNIRSLASCFSVLIFLLSLMSASSQFAYAATTVREIRYVGLSATTVQEVEKNIGLNPGDLWSEKVAEGAANSLTQFYQKKGFYKAAAKISGVPQSDGSVSVTVRVDEGQPCHIKSFWIDDPSGFRSKFLMERFKSRMHDIVKIKVGDRYDEAFFADKVRELRDWLVSQDFILANTDNVRLKFNDSFTEVDVVLAVKYGDRVNFGYQGNTLYSKNELDDLISQVRVAGLGKDYVGSIRSKFIESYIARGFNEIEITPLLLERTNGKHVTFVIKEGLRTELEKVIFEGLSDENRKTAEDIFFKNTSRLVQRGYFVAKDIDKSALVVLEDLRSRGFLFSKIVAKSVSNVPTKKKMKRVQVVIQFSEGDQTLVGEVQISGNTFFQRDQILDALKVKEETPFNPFTLEEGLQRLRTMYRDQGYLDYLVTTSDKDIVIFTDNNRSVQLRVDIKEGPRYRIGEISVHGLSLTKDRIVKRELSVETGQWWLGETINETEDNLKRLGLFSEVKTVPVKSIHGDDYRDMRIELKEADPGVFEAGPGFRSDLGLRSFARVSYSNIFGRGWVGGLGAEGNRRLNSDYRFLEYKLESNFIEPRLLGSKFSFFTGLSTKKQRFPPDFNAVTTQFQTGIERIWGQIFTTKFMYKLERIRQFDVFFQNQYSARDNRSMLIGSLNPSITLDTRDNPFTTTAGWLLSIGLEYAMPGFSRQKISDETAPGYQKWTGSLKKYTLLPGDVVWSSVVSGGYARSEVRGREIPLIKLFRLGGYSTIRGFPEDAINVDTFRIEGTLSFLNIRNQLDIPLVGELKFSPFIDAGNLYIDRFYGKPFFRAGAGVGLHYMTPIGPINLDWGHKLNPVGGESPNQIHFSVGMI